MGKYINQDSKEYPIGTSYEQKLRNLKLDGAVEIDTPESWEEELVCLVNNGSFAAAAYAYDEDEMNHFKEGMAGRGFQWFKYEHAEKLAQ